MKLAKLTNLLLNISYTTHKTNFLNLSPLCQLKYGFFVFVWGRDRYMTQFKYLISLRII